MSDRNLDPRAVAERLRRGEHVSLSQLRGSCATRRVRTHQLLSVIALGSTWDNSVSWHMPAVCRCPLWAINTRWRTPAEAALSNPAVRAERPVQSRQSDSSRTPVHATPAIPPRGSIGHNQTAAAVHERPFIEAELSFGAAGRGHACRECRPKR